MGKAVFGYLHSENADMLRSTIGGFADSYSSLAPSGPMRLLSLWLLVALVAESSRATSRSLHHSPALSVTLTPTALCKGNNFVASTRCPHRNHLLQICHLIALGGRQYSRLQVLECRWSLNAFCPAIDTIPHIYTAMLYIWLYQRLQL